MSPTCLQLALLDVTDTLSCSLEEEKPEVHSDLEKVENMNLDSTDSNTLEKKEKTEINEVNLAYPENDEKEITLKKTARGIYSNL